METIAELRADFDCVEETNPRKAAQIAYALACRYRGEGDEKSARVWAERSVTLFERVDTTTIEGCAAGHFIGGVPLPDLLHGGVVRARFGLTA